MKNTYTIPEWALNYLVNGSDENLLPYEKRMVDEFIGGREFMLTTDGGAFFSWHPEFGLAGMCYECKIIFG